MTAVRIILQSRVSSSRLPAKALLPIGGMPSVVLAARRAANRGERVVVATSASPSDDTLVSELGKHGIDFFRGSLDNVLERFALATADLSENDVVVRLTADNVFPDGTLLRDMVGAFLSTGAAHLGTRWPEDGLPYGVSAEVFSVGVLRAAVRHASDARDLEHVTPWIVRERGTEVYRSLRARDDAHLRATIDYLDDYLRVCSVFRDVDDPIGAHWGELCDLLAAQPRAPVFRVPSKRHRGELVSQLTLGTAQLGMPYGVTNISGQPSATETGTLLRMAVDHGVTSIDCASAYGSAETLTGLTLGGELRPAVQVITKLDPMPDLDAACHPAHCAARAELSVYRSLYRLRRARLDTLLLHRWSHRQSHSAAIWGALEEMKAGGLIGRLGASVYSPTDAVEALDDPAVEHLQIPFNLLDARWRSSEEFIAAVQRRSDVIVHARSIFLQGLLIGSAARWPLIPGVNAEDYIQRLEALAIDLGRQNRADLCIAYARSIPWITSLVVGVEAVWQLDASMRYFLQPPLSAEEREQVDRALPIAPTMLLDPSQWPRTRGTDRTRRA